VGRRRLVAMNHIIRRLTFCMYCTVRVALRPASDAAASRQRPPEAARGAIVISFHFLPTCHSHSVHCITVLNYITSAADITCKKYSNLICTFVYESKEQNAAFQSSQRGCRHNYVIRKQKDNKFYEYLFSLHSYVNATQKYVTLLTVQRTVSNKTYGNSILHNKCNNRVLPCFVCRLETEK
jgi:hypothetical protein